MEEQKSILENAGFKCQKCGYYSPLGKELEINKKFAAVLCSICNTFAPDNLQDLGDYISEKINWNSLETFRKYKTNRSSHKNQKKGMVEKARQGKIVSRPPFGYKILDGNLIPDEKNAENVRLIFEEFVNGKSLNQISKNYQISVNGIKKILKNFAYIGKVRFDSQISQGNHQPLISSELFNRVQQKFDFLTKKVEQ